MRGRRAACFALALGAVAGLTACAPDAVPPHSLADGTLVDLGSGVRAHDLLVLTQDQGEAARLIGALTNTGPEDVAVTIEIAGASVAPATITVAAGSTARLAPDGTDVLIPASPQPPGALASITLGSASLGTFSAPIPVLDGTLPEYTDLVPH